MLIDLKLLHTDPANARSNPPSDDAVAKMADSLRTVGQVQPIVVRRNDDSPAKGWLVTVGNTRVAAARKLKWDSIEAVEFAGDDPVVASAAENMVRTDMTPVETWRVLAKLRKTLSVVDAAARLGLSTRYAYQLDQLSRMAPPVIEEIEKAPELPYEGALRIIATAPEDVQAAAIHSARKRAGKDEIDWRIVRNLCTKTTIPRSRAIFDVEASSDVVFEQDFFAEPGSDVEFTTRDVTGFMAAQKAALDEQIKASKGRMILGRIKRLGVEPADARLWRATYEPIPRRFAKDDPRKVFVAVCEEGYRLGEIGRRMFIPVVEREPTQHKIDTPAPEPKERGVTKTTLARFAEIKGKAVRDALSPWLDEEARNGDLHAVVKLLLFMLGADNVSIRTSQQEYAQSSIVTPRSMLTDDGTVKPIATTELLDIVEQVVGRSIFFQHPNARVHSGIAADAIAMIIGAAEYLPRFDTPDILAGLAREELDKIAQANGIGDGGTKKALVERLTGRLPDWKPVTFVVQPGAIDLRGYHDEDEDEASAAPPAAQEPPAPQPAPKARAKRKQAQAKRKSPAKGKKGRR